MSVNNDGLVSRAMENELKHNLKEDIDFDFFEHQNNALEYVGDTDSNKGIKEREIKLEKIVKCNDADLEPTNITSNEEKCTKEDLTLTTHLCEYHSKKAALSGKTNDPKSAYKNQSNISSIAFEQPNLGELNRSMSLTSCSDIESDLTNVTPDTGSLSDHISLSNLNHLEKCNLKNLKNTHFANCGSGLSTKDDLVQPNMTLLAEALENLSLNSNCSTRSASSNRKKVVRKNMTFTKEQLWKIERENEILLRKITSLPNPRNKQLSDNYIPRQLKASAAINRTRQQKQIDHDNYEDDLRMVSQSSLKMKKIMRPADDCPLLAPLFY